MNKFDYLLLKSLIGFKSGRDEREQIIINEKITVSFVYSFFLMVLLCVINLFVDASHHNFSIGTMTLVFLILFESLNVLVRLRKHEVINEEISSKEQYKNSVKSLKIRSIFAGTGFTFITLILTVITEGLSEKKLMLSISDIIIWGIAGIIFGVFCYIFGKQKIKLKK